MYYVYWMAIAAAVLTAMGAVLLWKLLNYHLKYWKRRNIPFTKPKMLTGNMSEWMRPKHLSTIFDETYAKFKKQGSLYAGFFLNMRKAVIILDLNLARDILVRNFNSFEHKGLFYNEVNDPLTGNLFLLDGLKWRLLRTKLSPLFAPGKMKYMYPTVLSVGDELVKMFHEQITENRQYGIFDITYILSRYSIDVIANCVFGVKCDSLKTPDNPFYIMARTFFSKRDYPKLLYSLMNCYPEWAKMLRMKIIPKDVTEYYMDLVNNTIKEREDNKIRKPDYLDLLIDLRNQPVRKGEAKLTINELAAQAFSFFITGFDTCSSTLSYALYELAVNPDIQTTLRREILTTLTNHKNKLTYDCMKEMRYLDQVLAETLRKYPTCSALFRKCIKPYIPPADKKYYIEKDCIVIIPVLSYHCDPKYFPSPRKFDPSRFNPQNSEKIVPGSYLPFGDGQRSCIGMLFARMQIKIALIKLINKFEFQTCKRTAKTLKVCSSSFKLNPTEVTLKITKI